MSICTVNCSTSFDDACQIKFSLVLFCITSSIQTPTKTNLNSKGLEPFFFCLSGFFWRKRKANSVKFNSLSSELYAILNAGVQLYSNNEKLVEDKYFTFSNEAPLERLFYYHSQGLSYQHCSNITHTHTHTHTHHGLAACEGHTIH